MAEQITYRLAVDSDIERINDFYNKIYNKNRTSEQFNWEFNSAPAGRAIYVIAEEFEKIVGTQCAIPYYIITKDNKEILTAKSEDTLVSPNHRGKHIFDNMYKLLIDECKKNNIAFLWGFTYADKPFKKMGFEIPYKSTMGILAIRPVKAANYFHTVTSNKSFTSYLKILALTHYSFTKFLCLKISSAKKIILSFEDVALNNSELNYLKHDELFGIKLDNKFLNYRINSNAYNSNYKTVNWIENGILKGSIRYIITKENVGFIIHAHFNKDLSEKESLLFLRNVILKTNLASCCVIRLWGFTHNIQNSNEVLLFKSAQFVFLRRGISFVGLQLDKNKSVPFSNFVLSRMASQGTD
jgi:hypothetical protein